MKAVSVLLLSLFGSTPRGEVLEFTADRCMYCQQVAPTVARMQREGLPIRQIDADRDPATTQQYNVSGLPTFILVVDGKEVDRISGAVSESTLRNMVARIPAAAPAEAAASPIRIELGEPQDLPRPRPQPDADLLRETDLAAEAPKPGLLDRMKGAIGVKPKTTDIRGQSESLAEAAVAAVPTDEAALKASVLMKVTVNGRRLSGSGTIISSRPGNTLILTCGNLFATEDPQAKIEVEIPSLGDPNQRYIGKLVTADLAGDVGLVSIPTDQRLPSAPIAPLTRAPRLAEQLISFGAAEGQRISREQIRVKDLNKYDGPDNIECNGVPLQGRSGGGLFNMQGELVGVCVASGNEPNTGMYAGLKPVHDLLQSAGLSALVEAPAAAAEVVDSQNSEIDLGQPRPMPVITAEATHVDEVVGDESDSAGDAVKSAVAASGALGASSASSKGQEIVVVINQPNVGSRVMVIHRPSKKLLSFLNSEVDSSVAHPSNRPIQTHGTARLRTRTASNLQASLDR